MSIIKIFIYIYCGAILIIILYPILRGLYILLRENKKSAIEYFTEFAFWYIFTRLTILCLLIFVILSVFFLMLYFIWKALWFFVQFVPLFKDCNEVGLFRFFDNIFGVLYGDEDAGKKIVLFGGASNDFLKSFMQDSLGVVFPGYEVDDEFLGLSLQLLTQDKISDGEKNNLLKQLDSKTPIIKVTYINKEPVYQPEDAMAKLELENCIKNNSKEMPKDATTKQQLEIIFANAFSQKQCQINQRRKRFEEAVGDMGADVINSANSTYENSLTEFNQQIKNNQEESNKEFEKYKS
jgi:hypothetical protein